MKKDKITFFYPSKSVGGAQYLLIRLARELAKNEDIRVYVIDFEDGFIWTKVKDLDNTFLINYEPDSKINIPSNNTLVIFPGHFNEIKKYIIFEKNVNLIVWFIQPYLLINFPKLKEIVRFFMPKRVSKVNKLLNALSAKNSLLFMDVENFTVNKEYFGLQVEPKYLPIPTDRKPNFFAKKEKIGFNIAWMGRVSAEKVESIKYVLNETIRFNYEGSLPHLKFHIIGDGDSLGILQEIALKHPGTEVFFKGVMLEAQLEKYLFNEIDCMFVMGTSALDAAAYKIPTILLDYTSKKFNGLNYKFKWLFDSEGYMLGQDLAFHPSNNTMSLTDVIKQVTEDSNNEIGEQCFMYVKNNHDISDIARRLIEYTNRSTFQLNECSDFNIDYTKFVTSAFKVKEKLKW